MYEEKSRKFINMSPNVIKISIIAVLIALILIIIALVTFATRPDTMLEEDFRTNFIEMKNAGIQHFTTTTIQKEEETIKLDEMINHKMVLDFTEEGTVCNLDDSYVTATKVEDETYSVKVNLVCGEQSDYVITTITNTNLNEENDTDTEEQDNDDKVDDKEDDVIPNFEVVPSEPEEEKEPETTTKPPVTSTPTPTPTTPNPDNNNPKPLYSIYYKHMKTNPTYDYCLEENSDSVTYYLTDYIVDIGTDNIKRPYTRTFRLDGLSNIDLDEITITNKDYITSSSDFNYFEDEDSSNKVAGENPTEVDRSISDYDLRRNSLDESDWDFYIDDIYKSGSYYYVDIEFYVYDLNFSDTVYYDKEDAEVVFLPLMFTIESGSGETKCVTDSADDKSYYTNKGYTATNYQKNEEYKWSTSKTLSGYTWTGYAEYR